MDHFTQSDWLELRKRFRAAAAFIDQRQLENELTHLRGQSWLNPHNVRRLKELEDLPHIAMAVNAKQ